MIAVDSNLLIYATNADSDWHERALAALESLVMAPAPWGIPWTVASEYLGVITNRRIWGPRALGLAQGFATLDWWLDEGGATLLAEPGALYPRFRELALSWDAAGPLVHDARIASVCLANGVSEFWTADRDYASFAGLSVRNPLMG